MNLLVWIMEQCGRMSAWWCRNDQEYFPRLKITGSLDDALEANRWKYRPGMEFPDHEIMSRIGQRNWQRTEAAQRRLAQ